jgi:hypothetical protein
MSQQKEIKGRFKKGNTIGEETRFAKDNDAASKYKEEYCDQLIEYFNQPSTRIEYKETYFKGELTGKVPILLPNEYPTFELFAAKLGVTTETLRNWAEHNPRFKHAYVRAKELQFGKLTSNALTGLYNPVYAKFEAVNNHNQKDKQEVDTQVSGGIATGLDEKTRAMIERVEKRLEQSGEKNTN